MGSIPAKIGCTPETLRGWARQAERDIGDCGGLTSEERERFRALKRENRELRQANEVLRQASAHFAQAERTGSMQARLPGVGGRRPPVQAMA